MPTTGRGIRYPASSAAPNVPQDMQNLASDVDYRLPVAWETSFRGPVSYTYTLPAAWTDLPNLNVTIPVRAARQLDVEVRLPSVEMTAGGLLALRLLINNAEVDSVTMQSTAAMVGSASLTGDLAASGSDRSINVRVQGYKVGGGNYVIGGSSASGPRLRHRAIWTA